ncbi:MAG: prolipoprotein diacylglyceryl transferase [Deltaproteobacteria bacterium]|nr:prolipoprotein diacylglyceryl transferase [Deltaproteobacteria bacterium]
MWPVLLQLGPLKLHTYGFFVALGFLSALIWCSYQSRRRGVDPEIFQDLFFYVVLAALVGARLLYVFLNAAYFLAAPWKVFFIWEGGLVFYGGLLLALPVFVWRLRSRAQPILPILDIAAPGLVLAQAIGRFGCLAAGCCYGKPWSWGLVFRHPLAHAPLGLALHPTQLYHALANFSIFGLLVLLSRRRGKPGFIAAAYLLLYGCGRFIIEFWRGDPRGFYFHLSTSQWISILLVAVAVYLFCRRDPD